MTQTNLAVWVGADAAHRRQLGSVPRATEPAGVRAAGGWFTCKNQKISEKKTGLTQAKLSQTGKGYALLRFTCVLPELHHRLHRLRVGKSHEPEEFGPPTALMEIHLDGFLLLLEHLREKEKKKALGFR